MSSPVDLLPTIAGYDLGNQDPPHCQNGFEYGGTQYAFLMQNGFGTPAGDYALHCLQSVDGITWAELDAASAPNVGTVTSYGNCFTVCRDGDIVYCLYVRATFANIDPFNPVVIDGFTVVQFDLLAGLWSTSTDYASPVIDFMRKDHAGGQSRETQVNLTLRGAGDMIFYYSGPNAISGATGRKLARVYYATFDGATFGTGTELPDQAGSDLYFFPTGCVCGSDGITHFFYFDNTSGTIGFNAYNVGLSVANAFGATQVVTDQGYLFDVTGGFSAPITCTLGGSEQVCFLGYINDDAGSTTQSIRLYYAAAGDLAPAWAGSIVTQDQAHLPVLWFFNQIPQGLALTVAGTILYAVWTWSNTGSSSTADGFFYESHAPLSSPLSWTSAAQLFASSLAVYPAYQVMAFPLSSGLGIIGISVHAADSSQLAQYQFVAAPASATISCSITILSPGTVAVAGGRPRGRAENDYDHCLQGIRRAYKLICKQICPKPRPMISWPWDQEEGVPPDAVPFRFADGILTPFPVDGDVQVLDFRVPVGYDGIIMQGYNLYTGTGFVQGSGDILWRIQINGKYYVRDWGSIAYQLGRLSDPFPFTDALFVTSNQDVRMLVNVPNTSGAIQVGASRILGALLGYWLPR